MAELTIVIPTFRRHAILARTLDALEGQRDAEGRFAVVVVDDPAGDDPDAVAAAIAAERRPYEVAQLHTDVPDSVSAKRNVGWRAADTQLVLFIGDDILADPGLVAAHLAWHERHPEPELAMLGHVRWADEIEPTPFMRWLDRGIQFDYERLEGTEAGWGMLYTSNVSLKRELLERVGGFDEERFPFIYEDTDLGWRLERAGMRLVHDPGARAEHLHEPTIDAWRSRMAATARAERRWTRLHPELEPYFERLLRTAAEEPPPKQVGLALRLANHVSPDGRVIGRRVWWRVDRHYRRLLAPPFLEAWDAAEAES
jgi:GT2 family glycosyltransferase